MQILTHGVYPYSRMEANGYGVLNTHELLLGARFEELFEQELMVLLF
jgi:hypothetical protein